MSAQTQLRPNDPEADREAAKLAEQGVPLGKIAARFFPPLSIEQARAAIARGRHGTNGRHPQMPSSTDVSSTTATPARPQARAGTPSQGELPQIPPELDELLAWADEHGSGRARTVAARLRTHHQELAALFANHSRAAEARDQVAAAEKALAEAKARLRQLAGSSVVDAETKDVRAWAVTQGFDVPTRGRVPSQILQAFGRAHPTAAGGSA